MIPKPNDWGNNIDISGFFFLDLASSFTPDPDLAAFLDCLKARSSFLRLRRSLANVLATEALLKDDSGEIENLLFFDSSLGGFFSLLQCQYRRSNDEDYCRTHGSGAGRFWTPRPRAVRRSTWTCPLGGVRFGRREAPPRSWRLDAAARGDKQRIPETGGLFPGSSPVERVRRSLRHIRSSRRARDGATAIAGVSWRA